jgi:hypothetical protein
MPNTHGIEIFPAAKRIRRLQNSGAKIAVRQLNVALDSTMQAVLGDVLRAAVYGCEWERYLPELNINAGGVATLAKPGQVMRLPRALHSEPSIALSSARPDLSETDTAQFNDDNDAHSTGKLDADGYSPRTNNSGASPAAASFTRSTAGFSPTASHHAAVSARPSITGSLASSTRSDLTPFARDFIRTLMPRVWAALCSVPPAMEVELRRAFNKAARKSDMT